MHKQRLIIVIAGVALNLAWSSSPHAEEFCGEDFDPTLDCGCLLNDDTGQLECLITDGREDVLQCCTADDSLAGALIEIEGTFELDPAGPNGGYLSLPPESTVRSVDWSYGDADDPCTLEDPSAVIDGSLLNPGFFGRAAVTVGGSLQYVRVTNGGVGPCVDMITDGVVRGVLTDGCFTGIRPTDVTGQGFQATIEDSCSMNGFGGMPVIASDLFSSCPDSPFVLDPVTDDPHAPGQVDVLIRNSRITNVTWGLLVFGGLGASGGIAHVVLHGTEVSNTSGQDVRVVGGQDAAPDPCPGGNYSSATLVLAEGNTIRNGGAVSDIEHVGITIEGGVLGGGGGDAETSSGNLAKVVIGGQNEFTGNDVDVLLLGNWIQTPEAFPPGDYSAGDDNVAELVGNCSSDLVVEAYDCFPSQDACPSTARVLCPRPR